MRRDEFSRRLMREHRLSPDDLIYPVFVQEGNGREDAVASLPGVSRKSIDLLLLDIDLPFIDGHKVLEALREKGYDVPTIFVSGLPGDEPEVRAFEIGAIDFIRKPVKNSVLLARVKRVLG